MADDYWQWESPEEFSESVASAHGMLTLDGTGSETAYTFAGVNVCTPHNTDYQVHLTPQAQVATPICVKASSKSVSGFTVIGPNNSTIEVAYRIEFLRPDRE